MKWTTRARAGGWDRGALRGRRLRELILRSLRPPMTGRKSRRALLAVRQAPAQILSFFTRSRRLARGPAESIRIERDAAGRVEACDGAVAGNEPHTGERCTLPLRWQSEHDVSLNFGHPPSELAYASTISSGRGRATMRRWKADGQRSFTMTNAFNAARRCSPTRVHEPNSWSRNANLRNERFHRDRLPWSLRESRSADLWPTRAMPRRPRRAQ